MDVKAQIETATVPYADRVDGTVRLEHRLKSGNRFSDESDAKTKT
ncbi:hypothetical protein FB480_10530 [Agrobacterium vitis]|nr:hypothetical protein FB480_10530 [Agrobacterium vitis]